MDQRLIEMYKKAHTLRMEMTRVMVDLEAEVKLDRDLEGLADHGYALREIIKMCEDTRKECTRVQTLVSTLFGVIWASDPMAGARVRTDWCSCAADIKTACNPPDPDRQPQEYAQLMQALGIPEDAVKSGALKFSFQGLSDWMTHALREGKNLPAACGTTFKDVKLNIIARRKLSSVLAEGSICEDNVEEYF